MPVVINMPAMPKLKEIGVNATLLAKISAANGKMDIMPNKLVLTLPGSGIVSKPPAVDTKYEFEVYAQALLQAAKGNLLKEQVEKLRAALNAFLMASLDGSWKSGGHVTEDVPILKKEPTAVIPVGPSSFNSPQYAKIVATMMEHEPISQASMLTATALPLVDAIGLYRPVRGTDAESKYFLIAVFEGLKMACRMKSNAMSLRVEGPALENKQMQVALASLGFKHGNPHWSTHIPCDLLAAQRYVGCALATLPGLLTPMPDLKVILNKGAG